MARPAGRRYLKGVLAPAVALAATLALGVPTVDLLPVSELSLAALRSSGPVRRFPRPDLALHLVDAAPREGAGLALDGTFRRGGTAGPVCSGDVCAPVVSVPGYEPSYGPAHRSEAFVALLTRAHVEPIATLAWALVATGLRFDYAPPIFDGPNSGVHGWGSVMVRLRLRIDANGDVVVPPRPR